MRGIEIPGVRVVILEGKDAEEDHSFLDMFYWNWLTWPVFMTYGRLEIDSSSSNATK